MLVLTRSRGETIRIAGGIELVVVAVRGGHVRLGIAAPRETRIARGELVRRDPAADPDVDGRASRPEPPGSPPEAAATGDGAQTPPTTQSTASGPVVAPGTGTHVAPRGG